MIRRILACCQVQRPRDERVKAGLADQRDERGSEVVVGATGSRGDGSGISGRRTGPPRDHGHDDLPEERCFGRCHTEANRSLRPRADEQAEAVSLPAFAKIHHLAGVRVRDLAGRKLVELDERIAALTSLRTVLAETIAGWDAELDVDG